MSASPAGLFDRSTAPDLIRRDYLAGIIRSYSAGVTFHDDFLWAKILAAEAEMERKLRVFFSPVTVLPEEDTETVPAAEARVVREPGYDYTPDLFLGDKWGLIETRHTPIIDVSQIRFAYPLLSGGTTIFQVPASWMRIDRQYGWVQIVAASSLQTMPLNTFIMGVLGSGRQIPLMLQIYYRAGLQNAATQYPDLIDAIMMRAAISVLTTLFFPASGSISADGLSQSMSIDIAKYQQSLDEKTEILRQAIHGIRTIVM